MGVMVKFPFYLILFVVLGLSIAQASEITFFEGPYRVSIGPEVYHLTRTKEGGSQQKGVLGGVQASLERWRPNGAYWGIQGNCAVGRLHGHTARGTEIVSRLTEKQVEGRLGYNVAADSTRFQLIPFVLAGKYECENKFISPSPVISTFHDRFDFIGWGFYMVCNLTGSFHYGLTFKSRYMVNGQDEVSGNPDDEDSRSHIKSEWQYDVEIPLQYGSSSEGWAVQVVPFYCIRHFGGMEGFPFDFIDTKFRIYGTKFMLFKSF